jgi:hypothetical protein
MRARILGATLLASGACNSVLGNEPGLLVAPDANTDGGAGPDADATDVVGGWSPSALGSALVVWLDANQGVTVQNGVTQWADQSGNGNDAQQPAQASRPSQDFTNGHPVIRFDGLSNQFMVIVDSNTPSLHWGTGDFTVMEVASCTNTPSVSDDFGYGALWVKTGAVPPFYGLGLFANEPVGPSGAIRAQVSGNLRITSSSTTYDDGKLHYVGARRAGTTLEVRADGTSATLADALIDVSASGRDVFIGGRGGDLNRQMLKGDIAEIVAIKGTLSDADLVLLEAYLKNKYAL